MLDKNILEPAHVIKEQLHVEFSVKDQQFVKINDGALCFWRGLSFLWCAGGFQPVTLMI